MTKKIDQDLFQALFAQAGNSTRRRSHHNFHPELTDPVQRLCVALKTGTYIRPHKHKDPKWEMIIVLRGSIKLLIFEENSSVKEIMNISEQGDVRGVEIPVDTWHTLIAVTGDAVILEMKQGPYSPSTPDDYASWSPEEGSTEAGGFVDWVTNAQLNDSYKI